MLQWLTYIEEVDGSVLQVRYRSDIGMEIGRHPGDRPTQSDLSIIDSRYGYRIIHRWIHNFYLE